MDRHGVLKTVIAVGRVVQFPGFIDDAHCGFLCLDHDFFDLVEMLFYLRV